MVCIKTLKKKHVEQENMYIYCIYIHDYLYIYISIYIYVGVQMVSNGNGMKIDFKHDAFKHLEFQRHFDVGNDRIKYSGYVDSCNIMR